MPLYDFECIKCHHIQAIFFKMDECPDMITCSECKIICEITRLNTSIAKKIIVLGHGGIQTDTPKWINDELRGCIQGDDEVPIRTREDLARAVKEKNIEPIEKGHRGFRMI